MINDRVTGIVGNATTGYYNDIGRDTRKFSYRILQLLNLRRFVCSILVEKLQSSELLPEEASKIVNLQTSHGFTSNGS